MTRVQSLHTPLTATTDTGIDSVRGEHVSLVPLACNGIGDEAWPAPGCLYEIVVGTGNAFTITVTPSATYDTSIYLLSACGQGLRARPVRASTSNLKDNLEALTFTNLTPGTYFLGIDSFYPAMPPTRGFQQLPPARSGKASASSRRPPPRLRPPPTACSGNR